MQLEDCTFQPVNKQPFYHCIFPEASMLTDKIKPAANLIYDIDNQDRVRSHQLQKIGVHR